MSAMAIKRQHPDKHGQSKATISTKLTNDSPKLSRRHHNLFSDGLATATRDERRRQAESSGVLFLKFFIVIVQGLVNSGTQLDIHMQGTIIAQLGNPRNTHRLSCV